MSGGLHKRSAEDWGHGLRARGAELPLEALAVAFHPAGFVFLSLEDETGISSVVINPHLYERNRVAVRVATYCKSKAPFRIRTALPL